MPPQILALLPVLLGALGIAYLVVRPLARMWSEKLPDADLDRMIRAFKGAVAIADPIVASTPIKIDDEIINGLVKAALDEFVRERGRRPKVSAETLANVARAVAGKSLASQSGSPVGVSSGK